MTLFHLAPDDKRKAASRRLAKAFLDPDATLTHEEWAKAYNNLTKSALRLSDENERLRDKNERLRLELMFYANPWRSH
jgi:hypothetical protein